MSEHTTHHLTCDCRRTRCRSCKAPIVWAASSNGKNMPINAEADPARGNVRLSLRDNGTVHADTVSSAMAETKRGIGEQLHTSHFVTCPQADKHRRRT